jgi:hypothetical protein
MLIRYGDDPQLSSLGLLCNMGEAGLFSNVSKNVALGLPEVKSPPAVICGGGPSLGETLDSIRELKSAGAKIFALNNTAKFLTENGIKPDVQVIVDPRPQNVEFLEKQWADEVLLASQCHPDLFERCKKIGYPVRLWHACTEGIEKYIKPESFRIGGGLTVGLSSLCLVHLLGFREIHLFGYDSSHAKGKSHAYSQPMNSGDEMVRAAVDNQVFDCSLAQAGQATEFKSVSKMLAEHGCKFHVYGSGLLPTLWRAWEREKNQRVLKAVYDLGVSPPTYDFLSFLVEAERFRIEKKFDLMDVVFQSGPMHGFRHDELPPDAETRKGMLWRICAGMARLLSSVRNIEVLGERKTIDGYVFPEGWAENQPKSHYGTTYLKGGKPILNSSEFARRQIAKRFSRPYATISLREAEYWPARNSNRREWVRVADWLKANGIHPVIVPDTDGTGLSAYGDYTDFQAASFDVDLRSALYEGAVINLGVSNGPMAMCAFLDCRYIIFNVIVDSVPSSTREFLTAHGFNDGDGYGGNGKSVWKPDLAENIIAELSEFEVQRLEKTS